MKQAVSGGDGGGGTVPDRVKALTQLAGLATSARQGAIRVGGFAGKGQHQGTARALARLPRTDAVLKGAGKAVAVVAFAWDAADAVDDAVKGNDRRAALGFAAAGFGLVVAFGSVALGPALAVGFALAVCLEWLRRTDFEDRLAEVVRATEFGTGSDPLAESAPPAIAGPAAALAHARGCSTGRHRRRTFGVDRFHLSLPWQPGGAVIRRHDLAHPYAAVATWVTPGTSVAALAGELAVGGGGDGAGGLPRRLGLRVEAAAEPPPTRRSV